MHIVCEVRKHLVMQLNNYESFRVKRLLIQVLGDPLYCTTTIAEKQNKWDEVVVL